jgi:hypothetical protein
METHYTQNMSAGTMNTLSNYVCSDMAKIKSYDSTCDNNM